MGSTYRRLEVPGEDDLIGAGVHFCATCDGPFYRGQEVAVVGGGNSAVEESLFLTRFVDRLVLIVRGEAPKASKLLLDKLAESPNIEVRTNTEVRAIEGEERLETLRIADTAAGREEVLNPAALFVFVGLSPNGDWLPEEIGRDAAGFVVTDRTLETSMPGIFAAGDLRQGSTQQAASAAGEGATVALMVREYLKDG